MPGGPGGLRSALRAVFTYPDQEAVFQAAQPVRAEFPCGVRDCFEVQSEVARDDRDITVACPVHECHTTWPLVKAEPREQNIIRVQDGWHQHGTRGPRSQR